MNSNKIKTSVVIVSLMFSWTFVGQLPKKSLKEISDTFSVENTVIKGVELSIPSDLKLASEISKRNLFLITTHEKLLGYAYNGRAPSKDNVFDYLVIFDEHWNILKVKIVTYRENYGGEIASKRWLKQFIGKNIKDKIKYAQEIDAISGATISANSMTVAVNNLLSSLFILQKKGYL